MNDDAGVFVCDAGALLDGGRGVRFPLQSYGRAETGFVVRFQGQVVAYLNRCAHVPVALDWNEGDFFAADGGYLMCSVHGALYAPLSGQCVGGPCRGGRLHPIAVQERAGKIYWLPDGQFQALAME